LIVASAEATPSTDDGTRNVIIFSDGTGQRGGLLFDERRSNIYKLYRATRCGPDSSVDPKHQVAFYDPGLGTLPGGIDSPAALGRSLYNLTSQATGLGITRNIIDCYATIIRLWRPGDRIYLFGFSRGAYTVRCLGGVLKLCGVPTHGADASPLLHDAASARKLAAEGVEVYNYTNSRPPKARTKRQEELLHHRDLLGERFRTKYGSDGEDGGNARPYFVGVFDTVASLANPLAIALLSSIAVVSLALISLLSIWLPGNYLTWFLGLAGSAALIALVANLSTRLKVAYELPGVPWIKTLHLASARMKMYDTELDEKVKFARHAISIDEARASFARVPWGIPGQWRSQKPAWLEQVWFAGDHSDIGGSYAEDESRLSDITLQWMVDAASEVGLLHDETVLRIYPDPAGMQHDETRSSVFRFAKKKIRAPLHEAPLHSSVLERFELPEVLQYDVMKPYRPPGLRHHVKVRDYYPPETP
jgi:uncharacterized protein (DUF2235 family)